MTPEERAEKIRNNCVEAQADGHSCDVSFIAAEIRAAVEEAEKLALQILSERTDRIFESASRDYRKAKAEAYADAAKIAQYESFRYAGKALLASDALADVAKAIRARAKETL